MESLTPQTAFYNWLKICASIGKNGGWQQKEMILGYLVVRLDLDRRTAHLLSHGKITPDEVMKSHFPEAT